MITNIPLFRISFDREDVSSVTRTIKKGQNWAIGSNVEAFEKLLAGHVHRPYAAVFSSGTTALYTALLALGLKKGDEVIVPSFSFIGVAHAPLLFGAKTVFADIEEDTFGLDPQDVLAKISRKTKAVIAPHYGGCPCRIDELRRVTDRYGIFLIEDAAEAFGAVFHGRPVGSFGDIGVFSFCQNKIITTGEGGGLVTDSKKIISILKSFRSHGEMGQGSSFRDYSRLGINFRMSNITAALGVSQFKKTNKNINQRRKIAQYLNKRLGSVPGIRLPGVLFNTGNVYQMYSVLVEKAKRRRLIAHLRSRGIASKVYFSPIHLSRFYRKKFKYLSGQLPVTEKISSQILSLPIFPDLKRSEIDYIVNVVSEFFKG